MSESKDPTERPEITDVPIEKTREDQGSFTPVTPEGTEEGKPANPDPRESENPPPNRR